MKISGVVALDTSYTDARSKVGGLTNFGSKLFAMKELIAESTLSGRKQRITIICCNSLHLFSHSPGSGTSSGSGLKYHSFQSLMFCSKLVAIFLQNSE